MLKELSQTWKDRYGSFSLICGVYKSQTPRNRVDGWFPGTRRGEENGEMSAKGYTFPPRK